MRKNLSNRILIEKPKKQHLSTIPKSCLSLRVLASGMLNAKFLAFNTPNTKYYLNEIYQMLNKFDIR